MKSQIAMMIWFSAALPSFAECYRPVEPDTNYSASLEREYRAEIHAQYIDYFDDAQGYLNCLEHERTSMSQRINDILVSYRAFTKRHPIE